MPREAAGTERRLEGCVGRHENQIGSCSLLAAHEADRAALGPGQPEVGPKQPLEALRGQRRKIRRKHRGETRTAARRPLEAQHAGLIERSIFIVHDGRPTRPRGGGDARIGRHHDDPRDHVGASQHIDSAARQKIREFFARLAEIRSQALLRGREPLDRNHRPDRARVTRHIAS